MRKVNPLSFVSVAQFAVNRTFTGNVFLLFWLNSATRKCWENTKNHDPKASDLQPFFKKMCFSKRGIRKIVYSAEMIKKKHERYMIIWLQFKLSVLGKERRISGIERGFYTNML